MSIAKKFEAFCSNIRMDDYVVDEVTGRYRAITNMLNEDFHNYKSYLNNSLYVGSYGRGTAIHVSDIDMLFILPYTCYSQYDCYNSNGQSQLLQDIKKSIAKLYPGTKLRGDGQVVVIEFANNIRFEVLPCFVIGDGIGYKFPDTHNGGSWKVTKPKEEQEAINKLNNITNKNLKRLCRMIRAWKDMCNVDMGGLLIDTMAHNFLETWLYKDKSFLYYDYMTRDFFRYLSKENDKQAYWLAVGSNQRIYNNCLFVAKAKKAYYNASEAIKYEENGQESSANNKWKEIYGSRFKN
ncbi:MAG: hypothetical protein WC135_05925 [Bacteroidales bacterium]